jgi:hypothetical protein
MPVNSLYNENKAESESDFLNELKTQFERDVDLRKNLDNKANTMITISGSISTLLLAIATFLITKIHPTQGIFFGSIIILGLGIIFSIISISFFVKSYSLRKYRYVMGSEIFFKNGKYDEAKIDRFRNASKEMFARHLIKEYLASIDN